MLIKFHDGAVYDGPYVLEACLNLKGGIPSGKVDRRRHAFQPSSVVGSRRRGDNPGSYSTYGPCLLLCPPYPPRASVLRYECTAMLTLFRPLTTRHGPVLVPLPPKTQSVQRRVSLGTGARGSRKPGGCMKDRRLTTISIRTASRACTASRLRLGRYVFEGVRTSGVPYYCCGSPGYYATRYALVEVWSIPNMRDCRGGGVDAIPCMRGRAR